MTTPDVQSLLAAVRRHLWRAQFAAATRLAMWGSAGLMLLAVAVHLIARPVPVSAMPIALAALWVSTFAWAVARRPREPACALWADRHLGGASAFTTLLDVAKGAQGASNAQAVRRLECWADDRASHGLHLLAQRHEPAQLSRPLLSMAVCLALATFVLSLPGLAPALAPQLAASATSHPSDRPTPQAGLALPAQLVAEFANALRSAASQAAPERRTGGMAPTAGPAKTEDGSESALAPAQATPTIKHAVDRASTTAAPVDATAPAGTTQTAGTGTGRTAGDGRDERADAGVSRAVRGTITVQRFESGVRRASAPRQADLEQLAEYDEAVSTRPAAASHADAATAAATPPAATQAARLTATQTSYVQAWMKASAQRR